MEIVYFHKKKISGTISIEESFRPIIDEISKTHYVKEYNVPFHGSSPIKLLKNILYIRRHSTKDGINHISGDIHYGILGLLGRKSVITIHDDYAIRYARWGVLDRLYKWLLWIYLPVRLSTATVCISPATLRRMNELYKTSKYILLTHHTIPPILREIKKDFNKEYPQFLQIGTEINKNLETTLEVVKNIPCKLVVMKPMSQSQVEKAKALNIDFENKYDMPYEKVVEEYQKCDIVLFPSLMEGLGMPIYEAQAAGKPVITTNKEPMNWVAGDGALLLDNPKDQVEYYNAIMRIINDDEYRSDLVRKGRENSKRFSLDKAVDNYLNLYKSLIQS